MNASFDFFDARLFIDTADYLIDILLSTKDLDVIQIDAEHLESFIKNPLFLSYYSLHINEKCVMIDPLKERIRKKRNHHNDR